MTAREGHEAGAEQTPDPVPPGEGSPGWDHDIPPDVPVADDRPRLPRHPSTLGGACYMAVGVLVALGVVLVWVVDWRLGTRVIGGSLVGAAALRMVLPEREAGMLEVRSKPIDAVLFALPGVLLVVMASSIPDQPG